MITQIIDKQHLFWVSYFFRASIVKWQLLFQCRFLRRKYTFSVETTFFTEAASRSVPQKGVLKHFLIFTGKHLCSSLFAKHLQFRNFIEQNPMLMPPGNTLKLLGTPVLKNICKRLLLSLWRRIDTAKN